MHDPGTKNPRQIDDGDRELMARLYRALHERVLEAKRVYGDRFTDGIRPLRAITIAQWLDIRPLGSPDSRKRGVRLLIKAMRAKGVPIGTRGDGYFLCVAAQQWAAWERHAKISGLTDLARASVIKRDPKRDEAAGQNMLFQEAAT